MEPRGLIFEAFLDTLGLYFGHLRPLLSQASRLCSSLGLGFQTVLGAPCTSKNGARKAAFISTVFFRLRLRARGRFLFFAGFEALILKVRSPRGLKPRVAAGGREAIRIK